MARGWESKAVEAQQASAAEPAASPGSAAPHAGGERGTLMLSRTRALADLQLACAPAHRSMLEHAIADLDRRLAALE